MAKKKADPLYELCRSLPGVTEDVKWEDDLVFSVGGKMFAAFDLPDGEPLFFKTDPESFELLTQLPGISPSPYLARAHWVRLESRSTLPVKEVEALLRDAHRLVAAKLSKRRRTELGIA